MAVNAYAQPADLWRYCLPDSVSPADFSPGTVSQVTLTGASTGQIILQPPLASIPPSAPLPRDAYDYRLRISVQGDIGTAQFVVSSDAGVTWFPTSFLIADAVNPIDLLDSLGFKTGLSILPVAGVAPSFRLNDIWSFTTTAPPDLIMRCVWGKSKIDGMLGSKNEQGGRYHLPFKTPYPEDLIECNAAIATWPLMRRRGVDLKGRDKDYEAMSNDAFKWLVDVASYKIHPALIDSGETVYAPDTILGPDRYAIINKDPNRRIS